MASTDQKKIKLVISDFHLGTGLYRDDGSINVVEDFVWDDRFVEFIEYYSTNDYAAAEVELIINGDFFNLLQCESNGRWERENGGADPDLLTEPVLLGRTRAIVKGHDGLFETLRSFAAMPGKRIVFIMGNHDPGILFEGVRNLLRQRIHPETRFMIRSYQFDGIHVEHGNQYDTPNAYNPEKYLIESGTSGPMVNLPWGARFVMGYLSRIKRESPNIDKVKPFKKLLLWMFYFHTVHFVGVVYHMFAYIIRASLSKGVTYHFSIWTSLKIIWETPVFPSLVDGAKLILSENPDIRLVIFGHNHLPAHTKLAPNKEYINTGCWNHMTDLRLHNFGSGVTFTYALIDYDTEGRPAWSLKEWKGHSYPVERVRAL